MKVILIVFFQITCICLCLLQGTKLSRADKYNGAQARSVPGGGYCCKWTAYVLLGDYTKNQGGAKGWLTYGVPSTEKDAEWIATSSHVAPIVNGKVYNCPGYGLSKAVKIYSISDANKYIFGNAGQLRKSP
jgi:hypothetical protein